MKEFKSRPMVIKKPLTFFEKCFISSSLIDLAYRDYIAARFLLNNQLIIQGLTLASTAVEKYLKSIFIFSANERKKYHYHFDNLEKLKNVLSGIFDMDKKFDPVFLDILAKAYRIRYYDKLGEEIEIGIYLNQFLGELDETILNLETYITETHFSNSKFTPYWRAIESKDSNLYKNNFTLTKQTKQKFMEKPGYAFSINIQVGSAVQSEKTVVGKKITAKYDGRLSTFREFTYNWDNNEDNC